MSNSTQIVAFIDLSGSSAVFESLGNERGAALVTDITSWVGGLCKVHHGRVIKYLGDGVLALFKSSTDAVRCAEHIHRHHRQRSAMRPNERRMSLRIGMARGTVVEVSEDIYGDAVNLASRLCEMAGSDAILADAQALADLPRLQESHRYRELGRMEVRGFSTPVSVYKIEWDEAASSEQMTVSGSLADLEAARKPENPSFIEITVAGRRFKFKLDDLPITIGRLPENQIVLSDQRVSRHHARIELHKGAFALVDLSSYGCHIRFAKERTGDLLLRRDRCVLHGSGTIALGSPLDDPTAPTISFHVLASA